jgi:hypothetical protein
MKPRIQGRAPRESRIAAEAAARTGRRKERRKERRMKREKRLVNLKM